MENSSSIPLYSPQYKSQQIDLSPSTQVTEAMIPSLRSMSIRVKQNKEDNAGINYSINYSISSSFLKPYSDLQNERNKEPSMTMPDDHSVSWSIF